MAPSEGLTTHRDLSEARRRLGCADLPSRHATAVVALLLLALALTLRLWGLGTVHELIFDETYYVKDAYTLSQQGVEMAWPDEHDAVFESGEVDTYLDEPAYVVHPPLGKWLIALGMMALGPDTPWGWRISVALLGSLSAPLIVLVGRRLFRSLTVGAIAGLLLAVDGMHIVQSRTSLLDLPLSFFCLAAFAALLVDRDRFRERLARSLVGSPTGTAPRSADGTDDVPRRLIARPWRLLAGVMLGMACAVKWSGLYMLAVFGIMTVLWDWWARRRAGQSDWFLRGLRLDAIPAFLAMVGTSLVVYVLSWSGWLLSDRGYHRHWAEQNDAATGIAPIDALVSLWQYHRSAYRFHVGLRAEHTYMSDPWTWPLMLRPVNYYYRGIDPGAAGCEAPSCAAQILAIGNPVLWWCGAIAMALAVALVLLRRDGMAAAALAGVIGGWLPWLAYSDRTVFAFYAVVFEPWMVLCLAYALALLIGPTAAHPERRFVGALVAAALLMLIVLVSAFFWPIWTGQVIDADQWQFRMWLQRWT